MRPSLAVISSLHFRFSSSAQAEHLCPSHGPGGILIMFERISVLGTKGRSFLYSFLNVHNGYVRKVLL